MDLKLLATTFLINLNFAYERSGIGACRRAFPEDDKDLIRRAYEKRIKDVEDDAQEPQEKPNSGLSEPCSPDDTSNFLNEYTTFDWNTPNSSVEDASLAESGTQSPVSSIDSTWNMSYEPPPLSPSGLPSPSTPPSHSQSYSPPPCDGTVESSRRGRRVTCKISISMYCSYPEMLKEE
ncbi:hypothetical protein ACEPAI_912 [Sanghuangporus weigelae]